MDTFKNTQNITKCNNNNYIRVVKITQNGPCRTLLHKEICSINNFGQIIGFGGRVIDDQKILMVHGSALEPTYGYVYPDAGLILLNGDAGFLFKVGDYKKLFRLSHPDLNKNRVPPILRL